jgi:hypothetical protein
VTGSSSWTASLTLFWIGLKWQIQYLLSKLCLNAGTRLLGWANSSMDRLQRLSNIKRRLYLLKDRLEHGGQSRWLRQQLHSFQESWPSDNEG